MTLNVGQQRSVMSKYFVSVYCQVIKRPAAKGSLKRPAASMEEGQTEVAKKPAAKMTMEAPTFELILSVPFSFICDIGHSCTSRC